LSGSYRIPLFLEMKASVRGLDMLIRGDTKAMTQNSHHPN
jgi:hypothetical protein